MAQTKPLLVCGGSSIVFVIVECKAEHRGEWEIQQHRTSLDQLGVQHKCTVIGEMNDNFLKLSLSTLEEFLLYKVHQIGRSAAGEPTLLE